MRDGPRPTCSFLMAATMAVIGATPAHAELVFGSVGTELDDESGYIVFGAIGGNVTASTTWDLAASHADASTDFYDLVTTSYDGSVYHDFGSLDLRFGLGGWTDDEVVDVDRLSADVDVHGETWSIALLTELGYSDFETLEIDRTITRRDGSQVTIDATADCEVDDSGIGARARVTRGGWTFSIAGMSFDYDDFTCEFDLPALDPLRRSTRDEFVQLADRVTDLLSLGSGRRLLYETSFLDARWGLSVRRDVAARSYGAYFNRVEETFFGRVSDTLSASVGFVLRSGHEIEVHAGATDLDDADTIVFAGLSLLLLR
jgi:hypothetical protein